MKFSTKQSFKIDKKYLEYLPDIKEKRTQDILTLILTLVALSVAILFAISPTLSTITQLQKQIEDSEIANEKLTKKIQDLTILSKKYSDIQPDLPVVFSAIPQTSQAPLLIGQLQALAKSANVTLTRIQVFQVELSKGLVGSGLPSSDPSSFTFVATADGPKVNTAAYLKSITDFDRIISIDLVTFVHEDDEHPTNVQLTIRGKAYFVK